MAPYLFPYPTTGPVTFSNVLLDRTSSYSTELADATVARTRLQVALEAAAAGEPGSSALSVLEAVQVYLPLLRGIIACLDTDDLLYKGDPIFPWRPSLTNYTVSPPLLPLPSIYAEHFFVLLVYVMALSNYAHSILGALPSFEPSPGARGIPNISAEDEKKTSAALARAVDLLSQASGVAEWASMHVAPQLDAPRTAVGGRVGKYKWPVETGSEAFKGLSMMALADAHVTAIRRLLLPVFGHAMFAPPGPPLPANHPSAALLGKLYVHVASLYTSASALLRVHDPSSSGRKLFGKKSVQDSSALNADAAESDAIPELKRYLRKESLLSAALAYKWIGVDAGENAKPPRVGEAIGWITECRSRLAELEDGKMADKMKGLGIGKGAERRKEARRLRQGRIDREAADADAWIAAYKRMNDTVTLQPVPPSSTLTLPPGRPIFSAKAFTPPEPRLAPLKRSRSGSPTGEAPEVPEKKEEASYAGKGSYY